MNPTLAFSTLTGLVIGSAVNAQIPWTMLQPQSSPIRRTEHAMAYDSARQRVVVFGGLASSYPTSWYISNETWEWDGLTWAQRAPAATPPARMAHAMAYDTGRQRIVLFGGFSTVGQSALGDTWEWDGTTWTQCFPSLSPTARGNHAMAYHGPTQSVILFGGGSPALADTWTWDGAAWVQVAPSASPPARYEHAMTYDEGRHRIVLFGGAGVGGPLLGDTWEWDGVSWAAAFAPTYPPARSRHALAYDAARQRTVVFGGAGLVSNNLADTWEWTGTTWIATTPPNGPAGRTDHAMAYDAAHQRVVLFSGVSNIGYMDETWWLGTPLVPASATTYGAGCGAPPLGLVPAANGRPILGQVASATITNATTPIAAMAIGWNNQSFGPFSLPVTLAFIGMPGCLLLHSADVLGLPAMPQTQTTLQFSLPIPTSPSLIGGHAYLQAYSFAPGANALEIVISNGVEWFFGSV
jgi:hypothetical protein